MTREHLNPSVTVLQFAEQLAKNAQKIELAALITQLQSAGIVVKDAKDLLTAEQQAKFTEHLKKTQAPKKIALKRTSVSSLKVRTASGKNSTVNVVHKTRKVYVQREVKPEEPAEVKPIPEVNPVPEVKPISEVNPEPEVKPISEVNPEPEVKPIPEVKPEPVVKSKPVAKSTSPAKPAPAVKPAPAPARTNSLAKTNQRNSHSGHNSSPSSAKKPGQSSFAERYGSVRSGQGSRDRSDSRSSSRQADYNQHAFAKPREPMIYEVKIPPNITVAELAKSLAMKSSELIKKLMGMGMMLTINQSLDQDTAVLVVTELGHTAVPMQAVDQEADLTIEYSGQQASRPPVVTVMGHVDHGKTSLLDYIRKTKVTKGEAGGITQHIGAYQVKTKKGAITFLDTPGHAAFSSMRARGASCTDIVILVVAADDGVMPQTVEAIEHAKAAKVPIIVAVNKIDKASADLDRVMNDLSRYELLPEAWGGETLYAPVSALTGQGIDELLEGIMLQTEMLELKAYPKGQAQGVVIEARLDKGRGPVASVLVLNGCLQKGDTVLAGTECGKVKAMNNDHGKPITKAGPSTPIELLGLSGVPAAGDVFLVVEDEKKAKEISVLRQAQAKEAKLQRQAGTKLENLFNKIKSQTDNNEEQITLSIILRADVQGSLEAISDALEKLSNSSVLVKVVSRAVGGFTESDINLAVATEAIVLGFNVRADAVARKIAQNEGVELNYYSVIYELLDAVKSAMTGKMAPQYQDKILGYAEVRDVFRSSKLGAIAGCIVKEGFIKRNKKVRVLRNDTVIYEGELESLRRFKDNVTEVKSGMECGIGIKDYNDIKVNDQVEVYEVVEVPIKL